ncbi:MAG: hypothetical protein D6721_04375 [Gammaproteobacteria bacterium]|nr:MAG: hypothetical protein D6721_04375 [Gammaproteobacteria bacterium]
MTDITNHRPDDSGLRLAEQAVASARRPEPAPAPAPVRRVEREPTPPGDRRRSSPESGEWRGPERRSGRDRRQRQVPVLLDTRSHRERRRSVQRTPDGVLYRGIDEVVE